MDGTCMINQSEEIVGVLIGEYQIVYNFNTTIIKYALTVKCK